jgi:hypothetical protein
MIEAAASRVARESGDLSPEELADKVRCYLFEEIRKVAERELPPVLDSN